MEKEWCDRCDEWSDELRPLVDHVNKLPKDADEDDQWCDKCISMRVCALQARKWRHNYVLEDLRTLRTFEEVVDLRKELRDREKSDDPQALMYSDANVLKELNSIASMEQLYKRIQDLETKVLRLKTPLCMWPDSFHNM